jgi:ferredoxin
VSDVVERRLGGLTVRIDRLLCVGFGDCIDDAPEAFELDDDGVAAFRQSAEETGRERLVRACGAPSTHSPCSTRTAAGA